jgi:hypothetical protein
MMRDFDRVFFNGMQFLVKRMHMTSVEGGVGGGGNLKLVFRTVSLLSPNKLV